jgi:hypothetical protein
MRVIYCWYWKRIDENTGPGWAVMPNAINPYPLGMLGIDAQPTVTL